jgi:signal transduction histidine kinase
LSIVAAIVQRHGGRVTVDGSAFTVELPLDSAGWGNSHSVLSQS